jgi:signal transduction histidine kinase
VAVSDVGAAGTVASRRVTWPRLPRGVRPSDVAVALAFGVWGAGLVLLFPSPPHPLVPLPRPAGELVGVAALTVVLVGRRARPMTTALLTAAITLVVPGTWFGFGALYAAGAHLPRRGHLGWLVPLLVGASFVGERGWIGFRFNDQAFLLFASVLVALAGLYVGTRRELVAAAHERADRAEREQELLAESARAEERARLAAEMHDVVTHRVNLMVLQAGALGATAEDPSVRAAADELRRGGRDALAELRDLVGVLRDGAGPGGASPAAPSPPDPGDVAALVEESRAVGVAVTLTEHGDPARLAPTVHRTLVRVVQEALSNVRKHARGATVAVEVDHGADGASVAVVDSGGSPEPDLAGTGGGAGLDGLRRRVEMVGGSLRCGPEPGGGFGVRARLPAFVPTTARDP